MRMPSTSQMSRTDRRKREKRERAWKHKRAIAEKVTDRLLGDNEIMRIYGDATFEFIFDWGKIKPWMTVPTSQVPHA